MNRNQILDQLGIQQWRLNSKFANKTQITIKDRQTDSVSDSEQIKQNNLLSEDEIAVSDQFLTSLDQSESIDDPIFDWSMLIEKLNDKQGCSSCAQVTPILGEGNTSAQWMFVVDSPSTRDIEQQELLTGRVGQLFDAILKSIKLDRTEIYLSSIFKCPPATNLNQEPAQCIDLLHHQITLIKPKIVIALGEFAAQSLIKANEDLSVLRTQKHTCNGQSVNVVATYGLMQMLDTPILKADVWRDLKIAIDQFAS